MTREVKGTRLPNKDAPPPSYFLSSVLFLLRTAERSATATAYHYQVDKSLSFKAGYVQKSILAHLSYVEGTQNKTWIGIQMRETGSNS